MDFLLVIAFIVAVPGSLLACWAFRSWRKRRRRTHVRKTPLSADHIGLLDQHVHLYRNLTPDLRDELHGHVNVLLDEKNFFGLGGQAITDEVRLTVAGYAGLLLLGRETQYFPGFSSILIYPDTIVTTQVHRDGQVEVQKESHRAGESWKRGPVVLSWDSVKRGAMANDGFNVVIHEFAHKLDEEDGAVDGAPLLSDASAYREWATVLTEEFASLERRVRKNKNRVLDDYGLTNPPEFFAVATESFFEKGKEMQRRLPELYEQLQRVYRVSPADWERQ